jgi:predicted nucleotide-binding protein
MQNFSAEDVEHYFMGALSELTTLRREVPELYGDFAAWPTEPQVEMGQTAPDQPKTYRYDRSQLLRLARDMDQIFEVRANSELAAPAAKNKEPRVFISHGRGPDWREVQSYIERDIKIPTIELAQEPNQGRTVLGKLVEAASNCDSAVIVMTSDDLDADGQVRARENVLHEVGYFQGKYGPSRVILLHEEGVNIPSNIQGLVYTPFPTGVISATFGLLVRELRAMYGR